jgi:hypothetical protein
MYAINKAKTGIVEFDQKLEHYLLYLGELGILSNGKYALAGGAIRSIFDNTPTKDLDIYVLGSEEEHESAISALSRFGTVELENPFSEFNLVDISNAAFRGLSAFEDVDALGYKSTGKVNLDLLKAGGPDIQVISLKYDSGFQSKSPVEAKHTDRFADTYATSLDEVIESFDLTVCKAGVEFTVFNNTVAVSEIKLPAFFLAHVAMRKLAFSTIPQIVPQQLCSIKRFHKYLKYGYNPDPAFYNIWHERVRTNPHILSMSYENDGF